MHGYILLNAKLLTRHLHTLDPVRDLLERDIASEVWTSMLRLDVDREGREPTVIGRSELVFRNVFARSDEVFADLLRGFDFGVKWVYDTDEGDLFDAFGIFANCLTDLLVYLLFVLLGRKLNEEVPSVHLEHGRKQIVVVDFVGVDGVAITAGAGVNTNVLALFRSEAVENPAFVTCCRSNPAHGGWEHTCCSSQQRFSTGSLRSKDYVGLSSTPIDLQDTHQYRLRG